MYRVSCIPTFSERIPKAWSFDPHAPLPFLESDREKDKNFMDVSNRMYQDKLAFHLSWIEELILQGEELPQREVA